VQKGYLNLLRLDFSARNLALPQASERKPVLMELSSCFDFLKELNNKILQKEK
jgi:hypothetical protein